MRLKEINEAASAGATGAGGIGGFATTLGQMRGRSVYGDEQFTEEVEEFNVDGVKAVLSDLLSNVSPMEAHSLLEDSLGALENDQFNAVLGKTFKEMIRIRLK